MARIDPIFFIFRRRSHRRKARLYSTPTWQLVWLAASQGEDSQAFFPLSPLLIINPPWSSPHSDVALSCIYPTYNIAANGYSLLSHSAMFSPVKPTCWKQKEIKNSLFVRHGSTDSIPSLLHTNSLRMDDKGPSISLHSIKSLPCHINLDHLTWECGGHGSIYIFSRG